MKKPTDTYELIAVFTKAPQAIDQVIGKIQPTTKIRGKLNVISSHQMQQSVKCHNQCLPVPSWATQREGKRRVRIH